MNPISPELRFVKLANDINRARPVGYGNSTTRGHQANFFIPKRGPSSSSSIDMSKVSFAMTLSSPKVLVRAGTLRLQGIADYDVPETEVTLTGTPTVWLALRHAKNHGSTDYVALTVRPPANDGTYWYWLFGEFEEAATVYSVKRWHWWGGDIVMGAAIA